MNPFRDESEPHLCVSTNMQLPYFYQFNYYKHILLFFHYYYFVFFIIIINRDLLCVDTSVMFTHFISDLIHPSNLMKST